MASKAQIKIAVIGEGPRGQGLTSLLAEMPDVDIMAVCDLYEDRVKTAQELVVKAGKPEPKGFTDYKKVLKLKGLQAIITPSSWQSHVQICIDAMEAGLYVGTEVGGAYSIQQCWDLVHTSERTGMPCMLLENCCYGREELTILRMIMVPIFMAVMAVPELFDVGATEHVICNIVGVVLFIAASLTDMLDGKIARKYNLVTNFGKFMDPLADKLMVIGAMLMILYKSDYEAIHPVFIWATVAVIFRELTVTGIRMLAVQGDGKVIAANMLGKIKTVLQIVCICAVIIEPLIYQIPGVAFPEFLTTYVPVSMATTVAMIVITVWSGINYVVGGAKYIRPDQ
jgi:CDP-diacylglycerol--glycerol-3-phosphate 3-phosphatidyltransferase